MRQRLARSRVRANCVWSSNCCVLPHGTQDDLRPGVQDVDDLVMVGVLYIDGDIYDEDVSGSVFDCQRCIILEPVGDTPAQVWGRSFRYTSDGFSPDGESC